jgi:selenocysteine lyase/cysteine desulfurase
VANFILATRHGFGLIDRLGGMSVICQYVHSLRQYLATEMSTLFHSNQQFPRPLCVMYHDQKESQQLEKQGSIIVFNLQYADGSPVSFHDVAKLSRVNNIQLRTGSDVLLIELSNIVIFFWCRLFLQSRWLSISVGDQW